MASTAAQPQQNFDIQALVQRLAQSDPVLNWAFQQMEKGGVLFGQQGSSNTNVDRPSPGAAYSNNVEAKQTAQAKQQANAAAASNLNLPPRPGQ